MLFLLTAVENAQLMYAIIATLIILLAIGIALEVYRVTRLEHAGREDSAVEAEDINLVEATIVDKPSENDIDCESRDIWSQTDILPYIDSADWSDTCAEREVCYLRDPHSGQTVSATYRRSFISRLIQADRVLQEYYSELKNCLLSYDRVKARMSWGAESYNRGREQVAKLQVRGGELALYIALDPSDYVTNISHYVDVGNTKKYKKVPMRVNIMSDLSMRYAVELIEQCMSRMGAQRADRQSVDYIFDYADDSTLIAKGLIKIYIGDRLASDMQLSVLRDIVDNVG